MFSTDWRLTPSYGTEAAARRRGRCVAACSNAPALPDNRVHHVRDITQSEDASRIRLGAGPQLMAALRNTATNIARLTGHANIAAAQRTAAWSPTAITEALHAA